MRALLEVAATGVVAVRLHPLRNLVTFLALVVVLLPFTVGLALARGLEAEAEASARSGADLYVRGRQFGRPAPVPLAVVPHVRDKVEGVTRVVPRIVGDITLGRERVHAVLVGLPPEHFPAWSAFVEGELPQGKPGPNELVVGAALARRLKLKVGSVLLPFYHNDRGERLSRVVGVFKPDAPLWLANLILTTFETAEAIFDQEGLATDLLVWCQPGQQDAVTEALENGPTFPAGSGRGTVRLEVTAREDLLALLPRGLRHREGAFNLHFLLAFVVGILVLLVTSGLGLAERRREIGILKATGWQTDEVLLRGAVESLCLSLAGSCVSVLLAWVWLRLLNGAGVAAVFLPGAGLVPDFRVPFRLAPVPVLLAFVISLVLVSSGTLLSTWRAATAPPRVAMR
jgi:ABC-type lipoprotein release transport system permease subunit